MLKICMGVRHADALHDCDRGSVHERGKGHNLGQAELSKTSPEAGHGALSCITVTPGCAFQTPADFNAWAKRQFPARNVQSDEADELSCTKKFYSPVSPALFTKVGNPGVNGRVRLNFALECREVPHYFRVRVHCSETGTVVIPPKAEGESRCVELK